MDTVPAAAVEYARKHVLHALVVVQSGRVLAEAFGDDYEATTPHALYSGTKSFWGVTALLAQSDGLLQLDERVGETFPRWGDEPWKRRVTLRQLLQLTSGIAFGGMGASVPTYEKALAVALKDEPGTRFTYGGIPLQVFGAVLARKLAPLGKTPHEYLRERVLDPIGLHVAKWRTLADGTQPLPTGAFLAAAEWLKYGRFVCDHGEAFAECFVGSEANPRYGLGWWLATKGMPSDTFYASGAAGQALYVIPALDIVAVHFGKSSSFKHEVFLKRLLS